jgi:hypothetical protein
LYRSLVYNVTLETHGRRCISAPRGNVSVKQRKQSTGRHINRSHYSIRIVFLLFLAVKNVIDLSHLSILNTLSVKLYTIQAT